MASLFSSPPPAGIAAQRSRGGAAAAKGKSNALKRPAPRFLGDDDEDNDLATRLGRKKTTVEDIDKLFDDLDRVDEENNDDEDADGLRLPPPLKRPALDRPEASQSLLDDTITVGNKKNGKNGEDGEEGAEQKTRKPPRKRMIMNEERLLGDRGLRKLKDSLKGFKIKGKGHEEEDLRRLMSVYQIWAHQMFPGGTFRDTLESVEKLCHKRALQSQMRDWRDEARGIFRPKPTSEDATNHANINEDDDTVDVVASTSRPAASQAGASSPSRTNPSSAARPKKSYFDNIPTSSPGGALGGGDAEMALPDIDDEDKEAYQQQRQSSAVGGQEEEDDVFFGSQAPDTRLNTTSEAGFNDADLVFDLDDEPMGMDDDEDDMAALLEMERDEETNTRQPAPAKAAPQQAKTAEPASQAAKKSVMEVEEDNMDDFDFPDEDDMMREMEAAARKAGSRHQSKRETTSFYSAPSKPKETSISKTEKSAASFQPAKQAAKACTVQVDDNLDDFDFGEEEEILREMEMAEKIKYSAPPSLTTGSSSNANLDMDFELEEDEEFLKGIEEAENLEHEKVEKKGAEVPTLPIEMEEEEDLYS